MKIKNIPMKSAVATLTGGILALGLLLAPSGWGLTYRPFFVWASAPVEDEFGNLLRGTNPYRPHWDGQTGDLVQVLFAGGDGLIDPPDTAGNPSGDDSILLTTFIGEGTPQRWELSGHFCHLVGRPPESDGEDIYARIFNAPELTQASFYGDSIIFPALKTGSDDFDVSGFGLRAVDQPLDGGDPDGDGLNNSWEKSLETDKLNPDSDGDGLLDGEEHRGRTLPTHRDLLGWPEVGNITFKVADPGIPVTDPNHPDTDRDGFSDYEEVVNLGSDPTDPLDPQIVTPSPPPPSTPTPIPPATATPSPAATASPTPSPETTPSAPPTPSPRPTAYYLVIADGDYNGDGTSDIAIFRKASGLWAVRGITRAIYGLPTDQPVAGDYSGDGTTEIAIFQASSSLWSIREHTRVYFGLPNDIGVPADYNGDGKADIAVFRPQSGFWAIQNLSRVYFGLSSDAPLPLDYEGDGTARIAIYREQTGLWAIRDITRFYFGRDGDDAVAADYNGDGASDIAIFRQDNGLWAIRDITRLFHGRVYDIAVPADLDGDSQSEIGIFRPSSSLWEIRDLTRFWWAFESDLPLVR